MRLWSLTTGDQLAQVVGRRGVRRPHWAALFLPDGEAFVTSGQSGLWKWPVHGRGPGDWKIGPPRELGIAGGSGHCAVTRNGRFLLVRQAEESHRFDLHRQTRQSLSFDDRKFTQPDISSDGRWIASGTWQGRGIRIWNAESGKLVKELLPRAYSATAVFSPDGRWLVGQTRHSRRFFGVGTWKPGRVVTDGRPGGLHPLAFSPDGRFLAVCRTNQTVELVDPQSGRSVAELEAPDPQPVKSPRFSPDGERLAVSYSTNRVHVWDLSQIRRELRAYELDWKASSTSDQSDTAARTRIEIEVEIGRGELE